MRMGGLARWRERRRRGEARSLAWQLRASRDVRSRTFAVRTRQPHSGDLKMALIYDGIDPARQNARSSVIVDDLDLFGLEGKADVQLSDDNRFVIQGRVA